MVEWYRFLGVVLQYGKWHYNICERLETKKSGRIASSEYLASVCSPLLARLLWQSVHPPAAPLAREVSGKVDILSTGLTPKFGVFRVTVSAWDARNKGRKRDSREAGRLSHNLRLRMLGRIGFVKIYRIRSTGVLYACAEYKRMQCDSFLFVCGVFFFSSSVEFENLVIL